MHISSTEVPPSGVYAASAPRPDQSHRSGERAALVPIMAVCIVLAVLEVAASVMFDPGLLRILPG